jgi:hypothetical protein
VDLVELVLKCTKLNNQGHENLVLDRSNLARFALVNPAIYNVVVPVLYGRATAHIEGSFPHEVNLLGFGLI